MYAKVLKSALMRKNESSLVDLSFARSRHTHVLLLSTTWSGQELATYLVRMNLVGSNLSDSKPVKVNVCQLDLKSSTKHERISGPVRIL